MPDKYYLVYLEQYGHKRHPLTIKASSKEEARKQALGNLPKWAKDSKVFKVELDDEHNKLLKLGRFAKPRKPATKKPATKRANPRRATRKAAPKRATKRATKTPTTTTKRNPAGRKPTGRARRNPGELEAAARMSEAFHGRPARRVAEYEEPADSPRTLAELGTLRELHVDSVNGERIVLSFDRGVKLAANPDRQQLYFVGGDQTVDLAEIGMEDEADKDHSCLGEVTAIVYHTKKGFHDFAPTDYEHQFGEEGGRLPTLSYDVLNERLYLSGGSYQIKPEGITN